MNFFGNITQRRNRRVSETKSEDLNLTNSELDGTTSNSLPNISDDEDSEEILQLKNKIKELTLQLETAHREVEFLNMDNTNLKKTIENLTKKENIYKKLTTDMVNNTPKKKKCSQTVPTVDLSITPKSMKKSMKLTPEIADKSTPEVIPLMVNKTTQCDTGDTYEETTNKRKTKVQRIQLNYNSKPSKTRMKKLCILSSNKDNKMLEIAEDIFPNYRICHYLTPNCGIKYLISDLDLKLKDYNMNDYCLIFVGEEDFRRTKNYVELTISIRETLSKLQHTNIILCAPTFKLNDYSTMYNSRIETFNSLLYLDAYSYNYAYLFDSNYYLEYNFSMFAKSSSSVNNRGMANILHNISLMINEFPLDSDLNSCNFSEHVTDLPHSVQSNVTDVNELFFL